MDMEVGEERYSKAAKLAHSIITLLCVFLPVRHTPRVIMFSFLMACVL
jgi:hypothetical protein